MSNHLKIVELGSNQILKLEAIQVLSLSRKLKSLAISGNPFCKEKKMPDDVVSFLPQLKILDGRQLASNERKEGKGREKEKGSGLVEGERRRYGRGRGKMCRMIL